MRTAPAYPHTPHPPPSPTTPSPAHHPPTLQVFRAIVEFEEGGATAEEQLQEAVLNAGNGGGARAGGKTVEEAISVEGAHFMRGLLTSNEAERIGAGEGGFVQVIRHPWFADTDWEGMMKCEVPAPWVPPEDNCFESIDFAGQKVHARTPSAQQSPHSKSRAAHNAHAAARKSPQQQKPRSTVLTFTDPSPFPLLPSSLSLSSPLALSQVLNNELHYDADKWEGLFREFGPYRETPWPS